MQEGPQAAAAGRRRFWQKLRQCMRLALLVERDIERARPQQTVRQDIHGCSPLDLDAARIFDWAPLGSPPKPHAVQTEFSGQPDRRRSFLALPFLFEFWAMPHQLPPEGDLEDLGDPWRPWGGQDPGRGGVGAQQGGRSPALSLMLGQARRVALVGETIDQVREVMIFGESGLIACAPPDRRPVWEAGRRQAWFGPTVRWRRRFQRMIRRAYSGRSLMPLGSTSWRNGVMVKRHGTCCSLRCGLGRTLGRW